MWLQVNLRLVLNLLIRKSSEKIDLYRIPNLEHTLYIRLTSYLKVSNFANKLIQFLDMIQISRFFDTRTQDTRLDHM